MFPHPAGKPAMDDVLTDRDRRFADLVLGGTMSNRAAYQQVSKAGAESAHRLAHKLLKKPAVIKYMAEMRAKVMAKTELTLKTWLEKIADGSFFDVRKLYGKNGELLPPEQWPDDVATVVASLEVAEEKDREGNVIGHTKRVKLVERTKFLEMAGRFLGAFEKDKKIDVTSDGKPLPSTVRVQLPDAAAVAAYVRDITDRAGGPGVSENGRG